MLTVIETDEFRKQAAKIWSTQELHEFIDWIAGHPEVGDVIPNAGGARKIRWGRAGIGKRGGARVIYFYLGKDGVILLLSVYAKANKANMTASEINRK